MPLLVFRYGTDSWPPGHRFTFDLSLNATNSGLRRVGSQHIRKPVRLDDRRLIEELGREPHMPLDEAVEAALRGLGCVSNLPQHDRFRP